MKITYYLDVLSSWCLWAEPAWAELRARYDGRAEFHWKLALLDPRSLPVSRAQIDWYYRRSGSIVHSPFMLNSGWYDPALGEYLAANLTAEAAKDFGVEDDRVRLAIAQAGLRDGRQMGDWGEAVAVAVSAAPEQLQADKLMALARSPAIEERARRATREFHGCGVNQRPTFLLESATSDRVILSGLAKSAPLIAAADALLADEAALAAYAAHHGDPPPG